VTVSYVMKGRRLMHRLLTLALAVALAALIAACGSDDASTGSGSTGASTGSADGQPARGGTLTIGAASGIPQLNPVLQGTAWEEALHPLLWGGLTKIDRAGEIAPEFATRWTTDDDGRTWTFELRDDVRFSNGKQLTADSVVETIEYYQAPDTATQQKTALEPVVDVRADGPTTVTFTLSRPNMLLPEVLAPVKIIDVDSLDTMDTNPAVTGPFKVKEFVPDNRLVVVRNPDYYGEPTLLDEVRLVKAADATAAVTSLRAGDLDALWSVPSSDVPQLEQESGFAIVAPEVTGQYVSWEVDMTAPPFDDLRARQAVAYAIDREAIFKAAYYEQGEVSPTNTPLAENSPFFAQGMTDYSYDLDKARELFEAVGLRSFSWWGVAGQYPEWNTSAQILQASLKRIGVDMKIENTELGTWPNKFYPAGKRFPGLLIPNFQSYQPNPLFQLQFPLTGRCECNWNSRAFDDTYAEALATVDPDARNEVWARAQRLMNEQVPLFIPVQSATVTATQDTVAGLWVDGTGTPHLETAGFTE
jgi:peptide/nickel transport system substrate-binding protein